MFKRTMIVGNKIHDIHTKTDERFNVKIDLNNSLQLFDLRTSTKDQVSFICQLSYYVELRT